MKGTHTMMLSTRHRHHFRLVVVELIDALVTKELVSTRVLDHYPFEAATFSRMLRRHRLYCYAGDACDFLLVFSSFGNEIS